MESAIVELNAIHKIPNIDLIENNDRVFPEHTICNFNCFLALQPHSS